MKPSLAELGSSSKSAMVMGIGGGGDVVQAIPIANYLQILGVQHIEVGGVSGQWWSDDGHAVTGEWGHILMGPTVYDLDEIKNSERLAPSLARVHADSTVRGHRSAEAAVAEVGDWPVFVLGLKDGVQGAVDSLSTYIKEHSIDLFVAVDVGSDSLYSGSEVVPAHTCMVDFMALATVIQLPCNTVYGLGGYGVDGEMVPEELETNVAKIMRAGGYLGAYGITQRDVVEMELACQIYDDPIELLVPRAAKGDLGLHNIPLNSPWGTAVRVGPLAAVILLFDPKVMVEAVSTGALAMKGTRSLQECEDIFERRFGRLPETRLRHQVDFRQPKE